MQRPAPPPAAPRPQPGQDRQSAHQLLAASLSQLQLPTSPSRTEPISGQFQIFLTTFTTLTNAIFHQISTNTTFPNHSPQEILIQLAELDVYLVQLLNLHSEHDLNCKRMQSLMDKISDLRNTKIDDKIKQIYDAEQRLGRICSDGRKDKETFRHLKSRTHILLKLKSYFLKLTTVVVASHSLINAYSNPEPCKAHSTIHFSPTCSTNHQPR